ncbi:Hypothetical predicted protein [Mytilus galloprovincialis]|uniref:Uncharacterized protein n=1 Tax=Mytilus galloprovincialis TaxID=29158 RepID=A0A8B6GBN4_MYTGA|nr:Hypothetical predicted protein [Mytilus galloprovincialis]
MKKPVRQSVVNMDTLIFVKFFENGKVIDGSYFQKKTKATALFEFIGRDDICLESKFVSLSFEVANRKLEDVYKNSSIVNLNIVEYDLPELEETENSIPKEISSENPIVISDSPEKISSNVIEITSSPLHSPPDKYRCISSSSDDDQDHMPVLTTKRRRKFVELSDSSTQDTSENGRRTYSLGKRKRPYSRMLDSSDSEIEIEEEIPWNIDGNCTYRVYYSKNEGQRMKSTKDGRNWTRYNKSFTKEFPKTIGLRLRSNCKGSFQCQYRKCPFKEYFGKPNSIHVVNRDGKVFCEECNNLMDFIPCKAVKIWEFKKCTEYVTVHHHGSHTCFPMKRPKLPKEKIKETFDIMPNLKPRELRTDNRLIMKTIETSTSREEVEDIAESLSDPRKTRNLKNQIFNKDPLSEKLSKLQEKCLHQYNDPFLLFEYQIKEEHGDKWFIYHSTVEGNTIVKKITETKTPEDFQTYIIKSSKKKLETLGNMTNKDHFLGEEWAFMDFKVNRVIINKGKNLKCFGLSVYHTLLKNVTWLVRMDCENENKKTVDLAMSVVDKMLQSFSENKIPEFRPYSGIMLDEGGGMHASLEKRYGKQYYDEKIVTCQFHLRTCGNRHAASAFIGERFKDTAVTAFKKHMNKLINAETPLMYNAAYSQMEKFIETSGKQQLKRWLIWWDNRRNHVMEAFRDTYAPSTNLAEASHASMSLTGGTGLNILQTAIFDISECFKFEKSVEGYCFGFTKSGGGPSKHSRQGKCREKEAKNAEQLMKELDQQYKGGTAPCQPSTSSFKSNERDAHRADKGPEDKTRPSGRRRTYHSANYAVSLQKANEPNVFKIIDVEQHSPSQACITIKTSNCKFYSIDFDKTTNCSCPFSENTSSSKARKSSM